MRERDVGGSFSHGEGDLDARLMQHIGDGNTYDYVPIELASSACCESLETFQLYLLRVDVRLRRDSHLHPVERAELAVTQWRNEDSFRHAPRRGC